MKQKTPAGPNGVPSRRFHMPRGRYSGRQWLILGALLLLAMTGYEFWTRLDTIRAMLGGFRQGYENLHLYELSGIPFSRYALESMRNTPDGQAIWNTMIWLLGCIAFAVTVICLRNRPTANYFLLLGDLALFFFGTWILCVFSLNLTSWINLLKLIPLAMILAGCLITVTQFHCRRHRMKKEYMQSLNPVPQSVPIQQPAPSGTYPYVPLFPQPPQAVPARAPVQSATEAVPPDQSVPALHL